MIPFSRNRFFTGQTAILAQLADALQRSRGTALSQSQAISGLGGIGKTQIAIEYAYRHREKYQHVFWVRSDTHEALVSGYVSLAEALQLPQKDDRDRTVIIGAVLRWLTIHTGWLLILDNADDPSLVQPFLPLRHSGHILLTTRAQAVSIIADPLVVGALSQDEGAWLLLHRAGLIKQGTPLEMALPADVTSAHEISKELGGLPLALDQAGAYIEETRCTLAHYQQVYHQHRMELLKKRGKFSHNYPFSVATTWTLSFEKVQLQSVVAADLLRYCAFLHPDAIPEELFMNGSKHLGSSLQLLAHNSLAFDEAIKMLLAYSLIQRNPTVAMISIHRLVQVVLRDEMDARTQERWKGGVLQAVNEAFPEEAFEEWTQCERLLPHALVCAPWIERELVSEPTATAAAHLLYKAGAYLREQAQYSEAEPLLVQALALRKQQLGAEHPDTARSLYTLAALYRQLGKFEQAEPLFLRVLTIQEQVLGANHPDTARTLNNLGLLYWQQSKYKKAKPLFRRALRIREQVLGSKPPEWAQSLHNLGLLYREQGNYEKAEPLFLQALAFRKQVLGAEHPDTARTLNSLAELYRRQGNYEKAEPLFLQAIKIKELRLGVEHPDMARIVYNLGFLYCEQGNYEKAELLFLRVFAIQEQHLGTGHPDTGMTLNSLAELRRRQDNSG
jgi:tetratricopeptide (TPR) repeat protein